MQSSLSAFDVIIIGGSYAGLSAAMSLGRALRHVLVIDSGTPCNRQTPHSHNFLTRDGETPAAISAIARQQVQAYPTLSFLTDKALTAERSGTGFVLHTEKNGAFQAKKLLLATGLEDQMPDIPGFAACWGITVIHCPFCHGYEVAGQKTALFANGDDAVHFAQLLNNWTPDLTLLTHGPATFSPEQREILNRLQAPVIETEIAEIVHNQGHLQQIRFRDGSTVAFAAMYARVPFRQQSEIPAQLGCTFTPTGLIQVNAMQQTSVEGVLAAGDNSQMARAVAQSVGAGNMAGAMLVRELVLG